MNGFRFHTKNRETRRTTQNSGVFLTAATNSFSSSKDKNPILGDVSFYGVLQDIVEVRYTNALKFVLFKCDWIDYNVGLKRDGNFTLVNFNHLLYRDNRKIDEPFILASQAQQAWYVKHEVDPDWQIAMKMTPRAVFNVDPDVVEFESIEDDHFCDREDDTNINKENISWTRPDVDSVTVSRIDNLLDERHNDDSDNEDTTLEDENDGEEGFTDENSDSSDDDDDFFEDQSSLNNNGGD